MIMFAYPRPHARTPVRPHARTPVRPHARTLARPHAKNTPRLNRNLSTLKSYRAHARTPARCKVIKRVYCTTIRNVYKTFNCGVFLGLCNSSSLILQ